MNFYKILNQDECHYGLKYKTGLNIDPKKFNPSGDCESGGIYFSREDILSFIDYGPWIRKVTIPKRTQVYENPGHPKKWKAKRVILGRKYKITTKVIERLVKEGAKINKNGTLLQAVRKGQTEVVKLLIPITDPKINDSLALQLAARYGHTEIVKMLIPVSDPKANNSEALKWVVFNGDIEMVKSLIPVSDPKANNSEALYLAVINGHTEIVEMLIPVSDPKANYNYICAVENGYTEIAKLLAPVSDPVIVENLNGKL